MLPALSSSSSLLSAAWATWASGCASDGGCLFAAVGACAKANASSSLAKKLFRGLLTSMRLSLFARMSL